MNQIDQERRFEFGKNWNSFLTLLDEDRIIDAEKSLNEMLNLNNLNHLTFLDIGSGSGLFSLAAKRLGATVTSFDYDKYSVNCTTELKNRFFNDDDGWIIYNESALNTPFMNSLGSFDIVYSWGVLHHTGAMWLGIENALQRVKPGGIIFLALYNDQGLKSHIWWIVKYFYNLLPKSINYIYAYFIGFITNLINILKYTFLLKPGIAIKSIVEKKKNRGMSLKYDLIDWIGGYPFEYVKYHILVNYFMARGFELERGREAKSLGCHELVFKKIN